MINKLQAILNIRMHAFLWVLLKHPSCKWDYPPAKDSLELQPTFIWSRFYSWVHLPSSIAIMCLHMDSLFPRESKSLTCNLPFIEIMPMHLALAIYFPCPKTTAFQEIVSTLLNTLQADVHSDGNFSLSLCGWPS